MIIVLYDFITINHILFNILSEFDFRPSGDVRVRGIGTSATYLTACSDIGRFVPGICRIRRVGKYI